MSVLSRMKAHSFFSASQLHSMILLCSSRTSLRILVMVAKGAWRPPTYSRPKVSGSILDKKKTEKVNDKSHNLD